MILKQLHKHNDTWYQIIRKIAAHNFTDKNGKVHLEYLKEYSNFLGGDHVLNFQNEYWICQTVQDAELIQE
jgi:hypothetical protein